MERLRALLWAILDGHFQYHIRLVGHFKKVGPAPVLRTWRIQTTTRANAFCNLSVTHLNNDTASHLGLGDSRRGFLVPQRDLPHRYLAECRGDPAQVRHRSRNWGQSLTLRSDLPLPGDPTGGSIIRPKSAAGHASRLGLYHHPHTSQGSRPAGGLVRATPARSAVVAGPSASPERGRVAGPAYPTRAFSHLSHERHRGRPHRAASSA